jgi:hypothetical protein
MLLAVRKNLLNGTAAASKMLAVIYQSQRRHSIEDNSKKLTDYV